jgi:hypothetical protein
MQEAGASAEPSEGSEGPVSGGLGPAEAAWYGGAEAALQPPIPHEPPQRTAHAPALPQAPSLGLRYNISAVESAGPGSPGLPAVHSPASTATQAGPPVRRGNGPYASGAAPALGPGPSQGRVASEPCSERGSPAAPHAASWAGRSSPGGEAVTLAPGPPSQCDSEPGLVAVQGGPLEPRDSGASGARQSGSSRDAGYLGSSSEDSRPTQPRAHALAPGRWARPPRRTLSDPLQEAALAAAAAHTAAHTMLRSPLARERARARRASDETGEALARRRWRRGSTSGGARPATEADVVAPLARHRPPHGLPAPASARNEAGAAAGERGHGVGGGESGPWAGAGPAWLGTVGLEAVALSGVLEALPPATHRRRRRLSLPLPGSPPHTATGEAPGAALPAPGRTFARFHSIVTTSAGGAAPGGDAGPLRSTGSGAAATLALPLGLAPSVEPGGPRRLLPLRSLMGERRGGLARRSFAGGGELGRELELRHLSEVDQLAAALLLSAARILSPPAGAAGARAGEAESGDGAGSSAAAAAANARTAADWLLGGGGPGGPGGGSPARSPAALTAGHGEGVALALRSPLSAGPPPPPALHSAGQALGGGPASGDAAAAAIIASRIPPPPAAASPAGGVPLMARRPRFTSELATILSGAHEPGHAEPAAQPPPSQQPASGPSAEAAPSPAPSRRGSAADLRLAAASRAGSGVAHVTALPRPSSGVSPSVAGEAEPKAGLRAPRSRASLLGPPSGTPFASPAQLPPGALSGWPGWRGSQASGSLALSPEASGSPTALRAAGGSAAGAWAGASALAGVSSTATTVLAGGAGGPLRSSPLGSLAPHRPSARRVSAASSGAAGAVAAGGPSGGLAGAGSAASAASPSTSWALSTAATNLTTAWASSAQPSLPAPAEPGGLVPAAASASAWGGLRDLRGSGATPQPSEPGSLRGGTAALAALAGAANSPVSAAVTPRAGGPLGAAQAGVGSPQASAGLDGRPPPSPAHLPPRSPGTFPPPQPAAAVAAALVVASGAPPAAARDGGRGSSGSRSATSSSVSAGVEASRARPGSEDAAAAAAWGAAAAIAMGLGEGEEEQEHGWQPGTHGSLAAAAAPGPAPASAASSPSHRRAPSGGGPLAPAAAPPPLSTAQPPPPLEIPAAGGSAASRSSRGSVGTGPGAPLLLPARSVDLDLNPAEVRTGRPAGPGRQVEGLSQSASGVS